MEDTLVVNVGDMLHAWRGGKYRSARHRLLNNNKRDRYSVPFFYEGTMSSRNPFAPDETGLTVEEHITAMYKMAYEMSKN